MKTTDQGNLRTLWTARGKALADDRSRPVGTTHPRPLLRRPTILLLNGWWDFEAGTDGQPPRSIRVPFPPEAALSGIGEHFPEGTPLIYRRQVSLPETLTRALAQGGRLLLHIDAADQTCRVLANEKEIGSHTGGYEHCTFDLTQALTPQQAAGDEPLPLRIEVRDDLRDLSQPYGKQVLKRGGMWYTPFSGLWQSVWLEAVPAVYAEEITIRTDLEKACIRIRLNTEAEGTPLSACGHVTVASPHGAAVYAIRDGEVTVRPDEPRLWSPEDPFLYRIQVRFDPPAGPETAGNAAADTFESYFALRQIGRVRDGNRERLTLNGKPYFFHGLLDQGYYSDGLCTPADSLCYDEDIRAMKALGFNLLRKHIRIEPDTFYEACDRLGMIVCQDMVNNGRYSFFTDTALPTAGIQRLPDKNRHRDPAVRQNFEKTMRGCVRQLGSFPCILFWTVFNEGWGQFESDRMSRLLRSLDPDPSRIIDAASGWFRSAAGDVESLHIYFRPVVMKESFFRSGRPVILSEFGGIVYREEEHCYNPDKTYGYGTAKTRREYAQRVLELYEQQILPAVREGLSAAVYTQVSDVEDEINGILTFDRRVNKLGDPETAQAMRDLSRRLQEAAGGAPYSS